MAKTKVLICPYCGETQPAGDVCKSCGGLFEPLSRQATHNAMGPWFIRDPDRPHHPGCSYDTLTKLIQRGAVTKLTIVRGPTTKQYWTVAKRVAGISHLLGYCHQCDSDVSPSDHGCAVCGATFGAYLDRNYLGLPELRPLPWEESVSGYPDSTATPGEASGSPGQISGIAAFHVTLPPGRISSFATNEELQASQRGRSSPPPAGNVPATAQAGGNEPESANMHSGETRAAEAAPIQALRQSAAMPVPAHDDTALRLARRRALHYQKTGQRLWIALALSVAANVVLASIMFARGGSEVQATPATKNNTQPASNSSQSPAATGGTAANPQPGPEEPGGDAAAIDEEADAPSQPEIEESPGETASNDSAAQQYRTMLEEAAALIASAGDDSRELAERIADYERAIEILKDVRVNAPASVRPVDIAEQIDQAESDLERLKLREFFP